MPDRTTSDRPVVSIRFSAAEIASRVEEMATDLSAKLASDTSEGGIEDAVRTLSERRFVVVDDTTEELLIRS